jgi:competence protein ComEA
MEEHSKETTELNAKIAAHADECTSMKVEIEMWKRLYEKALDQVCSVKLSGDVARRTEKEVPVIREEKPEPPEVDLVDINSASFSELKACGFTDNVILQIIQKRPHQKVEDLQSLNGLTSMGYQILSKKVCCIPPPKPQKTESTPPSDKKVNVNKMMSAAQLKNLTGMSMRCAAALVAHRKKNGDFKAIDELTKVDGFGQTAMNRYGHMLEV